MTALYPQNLDTIKHFCSFKISDTIKVTLILIFHIFPNKYGSHVMKLVSQYNYTMFSQS
jgi:hypothetical protein